MSTSKGDGEQKPLVYLAQEVEQLSKQFVDVHMTATQDASASVEKKKQRDIWLVIHGKVYNPTAFTRDHPGGVEVWLEVNGADATKHFEDMYHSEEAREILKTFEMGVVKGSGPDEWKMLEEVPMYDSDEDEAYESSFLGVWCSVMRLFADFNIFVPFLLVVVALLYKAIVVANPETGD